MKSTRFSAKHAAGVGVVIVVAAATMASAMTTGPIALFAYASAPAQEALITDGANAGFRSAKRTAEANQQALASSRSSETIRAFDSMVSPEALKMAASNNLREADPPVEEAPTPGSGGGAGGALGGGAGGGGGIGGAGLGLLAAAGVAGGIAAATSGNNNPETPNPVSP